LRVLSLDATVGAPFSLLSRRDEIASSVRAGQGFTKT
jgi:hypothetical protein